MKYVITGCDGQLGGRVAENMLSNVNPRNLIFTCPDPKRLPAETVAKWNRLGIEICTADYDKPEQMWKVFKGADRIFIVSGVLIGEKRVQQHRNVINAAVKAGLKHITYTSFLGATDPRYAHVYVTPDHTATEEYLQHIAADSGIEYNVMRNNLYMENYLTTSVMLALLSGNKWYTTAGEGKGTFISKDDSALAATVLLLGAGQKNTAYNITGKQAISQREICQLISEASGIPLQYCPVDKEAFFAYLDSIGIPRTTDGDYSRSPVPWCGNDMVTNEASIAEGLMDFRSDDFYKLTLRIPKTAKDLVQRYSYIWKEKISNWKDIK
ncbi:NmrA family NAD(P)-binding protein [Martelella alba]|uniref:NAD(P)-dependent oxidoreductase n=1 Tax=Martelella alba TaxID=2590451 RepID=A0ABY2SKX1_9HYPH|nr:NmrA family NAD(P)-binding protein [Martelella alba]TKI05980.1 NAD(P)-dependent oxidoreductase [Martelella alba]